MSNLIGLTEPKTIFESIIKRSITAILYILIYNIIYTRYLSITWGYFGYNLNDVRLSYFIITIIIAYFPIVFFRGILRISSFFSILIYILGYVPIILTLMYNSHSNSNIILSFQLSIMLGMILLFLIDKINFNIIFKIKTKKKLPFYLIHIITLGLSLYILFIFKGNMRLVNFTDVYELRSSNKALVSEDLTGYFIMWLGYCLYPLYFTLGLANRKLLYSFIGILGEIFLYTITGSKASLLEPVIILIFFLILNIKSKFSFFQLIVFSILILYLLILTGTNPMTLLIGSIFFMRTLSIGGLLSSQYLDFFQHHNMTYYSHINIINLITNNYPYGNESLGDVLGYYYYSKNVNSNAIFWATDGIAAMGQYGVIIISIIVMLFFAFLNSNFKRTNNLFMPLIFTPAILTILNASFFTTLLSGGLLLLVIMMLMFDIPYTGKNLESNN